MVLLHYGVKGQKWGVRRYENYDGTLTSQGKVHYSKNTIRKGTVLNTVVGLDTVNQAYDVLLTDKAVAQKNLINRGQKWIYAYLKNNDWDNKVYKGPFSQYLIAYQGKKYIAQLQYQTLDDIKMPSKRERIEEFKKLYKTNRDEINKMVFDHIDRRLYDENSVQYETDRKRYQAEDTYVKMTKNKDLTTKHDWENAYEAFNNKMQESYLYNSTKQYSKNIQSKYGGMVDDNNKGIYNNAVNPVIIFNVNKQLKAIGQKLVPYSEIIKNSEYVKDSLKKLGKEMLL